MSYAKINSKNEIIVFPYNSENLKQENPYTSFGAGPNLIELYSTTEDAVNNNYSLVEVIEEDRPGENTNYKNVTKNELPSLIDGVWHLKYTITDKSQEEIDAFVASIPPRVKPLPNTV